MGMKGVNLLKKPTTFLLGIFIILLISLFGCSHKTNDTTTPGVPDHIAIKQISSENLSPWKITLTPYKKANHWLCDIKIENKSSSTLSDVSGTIGGTNVTRVGLLQPNSVAFSSNGTLVSKNNKLNITLAWSVNGKEFNRKVVYDVK